MAAPKTIKKTMSNWFRWAFDTIGSPFRRAHRSVYSQSSGRLASPPGYTTSIWDETLIHFSMHFSIHFFSVLSQHVESVSVLIWSAYDEVQHSCTLSLAKTPNLTFKRCFLDLFLEIRRIFDRISFGDNKFRDRTIREFESSQSSSRSSRGRILQMKPV